MTFGLTPPLTLTLGLKVGSKVSVINPPRGFVQRLNPLPDGVEFLVTAQSGLDVILFFSPSHRELLERLPALSRALAPMGGLWVAWPDPKELVSGLSESVVRQAALDLGLVDNKRATLDSTWEALRLVWRPRGRPEKPEVRRPKAPVAEA